MAASAVVHGPVELVPRAALRVDVTLHLGVELLDDPADLLCREAAVAGVVVDVALDDRLVAAMVGSNDNGGKLDNHQTQK